MVPPAELDDAIDRALAIKLTTVGSLTAELDRRRTQGRPGVWDLRWALKWRQDPRLGQPSVLESKALRLLHNAGIIPLATEVTPHRDLGYRVDILLGPGLALEVDGYSYHHSAEQMTKDARRRNRLSLAGTRVLVYTWRDIAYDGHRVLAEVRAAMAQAAAG